MHADGGVEAGIALCQTDGGFEIGRPVAGADGHHAFDAGGAGALQHLVAVGVELGIVQVDVRVDQRHFKRAPTGMSSWKPASTGLPSLTEAATIMPLDSIPCSLRGCRLATMTTLRFDQVGGGVGFGDAGDNGARLRLADVHGHVHEFVGAFDGLGGEDQAHAEVDFEEVVDGDLVAGLDRRRCLCHLAEQGLLFGR